MKILKYILGIIAALVVIFFMIGVFVSTFTYENKVEVNAPVEKAWAVFTDESRMGEWLTGLKSIETISGNPGEVGSIYRLVFVQNGEEMVMTEEVTAFQQNELFAFNLDNDVMIETTASEPLSVNQN